MQAAGEATGDGIRKAMRRIANPPGTQVSSAVDGIAAAKAGQDVDYDGASGSCDFDDNGDLMTKSFYVFQVKDGKMDQIGLMKA
jgi:branched-chain amino acid transport system substrate-binding protein